MRLIFVARKFDDMAGGLERISIDLMNAMVRRGHSVSLMTWDRKDAVTHYPLDSRVQWLKLDIGNPDIAAGSGVKAARIRTFRKFVSSFSPDAILGFQSGAALFSRIATLGMGIKNIAAERVSPDMWKYVRTDTIDRLTDIYSLMLSDRITVQFSSYIEKYPRILRRRMVAIHNPVFEPEQQVPGEKVINGKVLLYVARLCYQKNHGLLIDAFSRISDFRLFGHPQHANCPKVDSWSKGASRSQLRKTISDKGCYCDERQEHPQKEEAAQGKLWARCMRSELGHERVFSYQFTVVRLRILIHHEGTKNTKKKQEFSKALQSFRFI